MVETFGQDYVNIQPHPDDFFEPEWRHERQGAGWVCFGLNGKTADADPLQAIEILRHATDYLYDQKPDMDTPLEKYFGDAMGIVDEIRYKMELAIGLRQKEEVKG
jgi:hypothetical protein